MNPLFMLLNPRLILGAIVVLLLGVSHLYAYHRGGQHVQARWDVAQAQATQAALIADKIARLKEQALVEANNQLEKKYVALKATTESHAAATRAELQRLSDTLDATNSAARQGAPTSPRIDGASTVESELLRQCAAALTDMGASADRLSLQVVGLQSYVTDVCR
jgi:vancomycin resistance protein YoaR